MPHLTFVVPRPAAPSGGHRYNAAVVADWPGSPPSVVELDGPWPLGDRDSLQQLRAALVGCEVALVDGLVGAAHPDELANAARSGTRIVLLIHLPLAQEGGLSEPLRAELARREERSVREAWRVVTTSATAARQLATDCGRDDIVAVPPGVSPAPLAEPHDPPGILQVGSIGPRKNQLATIDALAGCRDFAWTMTFAGPVADEAYARRFRSALDAIGATWTGPLADSELATAYAHADLMLHPAEAETWGMVVTEALARGVPVIVAAGTGAVEALGSGTHSREASAGLPGEAVPLDQPGALSAALRGWLADPLRRAQWRTNASNARTGLRRWPMAAVELAHVVRSA